jgi:hypothetical protein
MGTSAERAGKVTEMTDERAIKAADEWIWRSTGVRDEKRKEVKALAEVIERHYRAATPTESTHLLDVSDDKKLDQFVYAFLDALRLTPRVVSYSYTKSEIRALLGRDERQKRAPNG